MKSTPNDLALTVAHVMTRLPDSWELRKVVLGTLLELLPRDCKQLDDVARALEMMNAQEHIQHVFQKELPLKFQQ